MRRWARRMAAVLAALMLAAALAGCTNDEYRDPDDPPATLYTFGDREALGR